MSVFRVLVCLCLVACGSPGIEDGRRSDGSTDNSAIAVFDPSEVVRALCKTNPLTDRCARECEEAPELTFCVEIDRYCEAPSSEDVAFCAGWNERRSAWRAGQQGAE